MKRFLIPIATLSAFLPVFAISAQKISVSETIPATIVANLNPEIVPGDQALSSTVLVVSSDATSPPVQTRTSCPSKEAVLFSAVSPSGEIVRLISLRFSPSCTQASFWLTQSGKTVSGSAVSVPTVSKERLFLDLSDLSDDALFEYARDTAGSADGLLKSITDARTPLGSVGDKLKALSLSYREASLRRKSDAAFALVAARRDLRYLVPIEGSVAPTEQPYVPGSPRPYRKETTDAIHHGWDFLAPVGTPVRAIGDGVVVRVVNGFVWKDFERLVKPPKDGDAKLRNLDVYRGNQVWIKTADGNVAFYSHLSAIAP